MENLTAPQQKFFPGLTGRYRVRVGFRKKLILQVERRTFLTRSH